jgi:hypothetical protein
MAEQPDDAQRRGGSARSALGAGGRKPDCRRAERYGGTGAEDCDRTGGGRRPVAGVAERLGGR